MIDKRYKITESEIKEIKRLRKEDPVFWSYAQLAMKFRCSSANICYHVRNRNEVIKKNRREK